jgi:hypothetical protein
MEKDGENYTNLVKNEEVLNGVKRKGTSCLKQKEGRLTGLVTSFVGTAI